MKKILFILTAVLFSLSTFAQRVAFNKSIGIEMPKNLNKISKEQALSHANEKFKGDKIASSFYTDIDTSNSRLYQVGDIIVELKSVDSIVHFEAGHAEKLKRELDGMARKVHSYTSFLKIIDNNTVVVTNSIVGTIGYCYFFCFNEKNTRLMSGCLIYAEADKDKVMAVANDVITGIKFKD
jgi:hypothetical protein